MKDLMQRVERIAQQNPDGFTISLPECKFVKSGWVVAMKETQNSFGIEGLKTCLNKSLSTTKVLGGWNEGSKFYFDSCYLIEDEETATKLGIENDQLAIFSIDQLRVKELTFN